MAQRKVLVGLAITIALLAVPFALYAQETDPASLCYDAERMAAFGTGDFDTVLAVWADDAVQTIVVGVLVAGNGGGRSYALSAPRLRQMLA